MAKMMKEETKAYDLDLRIYRLLQDEPFFARLSRRLDKRAMESVSTAGIMYNKDSRNFEIVYNPKFMGNLSEVHQKWVLKHELYHASLGHCTTRTLTNIVGDNKQLANVAMDLAINSLPGMVHDAPDFVLMPGRGNYQHITSQEQSADWYANKLKQVEDEDDGNGERGEPGQPGEGGSGDGNGPSEQFDSHEGFGGGGDMTDEERMEREIAGRRIADAVSEAARECDVGDGESPAAGWGSVSHRVRKEIKKFADMNKAKLSPKAVLASFVKASVNADKKTSVTKRNRRLPGRKFGKRSDRRANVAISIDQSGSVSDQMLFKVYDWLNEFAKFASFTIVPFDHQVFEEKVYVWKKGDKRKKERVLCGGTCFTAPTKFVNKRNFDGHIIITDMCASKPIRSSCQRMWITDEYGARGTYFKPVGERVLVL